MVTNDACKICGNSCQIGGNFFYEPSNTTYKCDFCGIFLLDSSSYKLDSPRNKAVFAYHYHRFLKKNAKENEPIKITEADIKKALANGFPSPNEQLNNIILHIGEKTKEGVFGEPIVLDLQKAPIIVGTTNDGLEYLITELKQDGYISFLTNHGKNVDCAPSREFRLTIKGFEKYESLLKGVSESKKVFMAMQYDQEDLDKIFNDVFKPAVTNTGFELYRLDEKPQAGIIDNRLRVDIRNSKFLIADITSENQGVYWEAGFAEGLGKKVIFTCKKGKECHFDVRNMQIVFWDEEKTDEFKEDLKAVIRNSFPDEAKMED